MSKSIINIVLFLYVRERLSNTAIVPGICALMNEVSIFKLGEYKWVYI